MSKPPRKHLENLFAKNPPKKPLVSLKDFVDDWQFRFGAKGASNHLRDDVVDFASRARHFDEAVSIACNSLRPNGKCHNHQSRVPRAVRSTFGDAIKADRLARKAKTFDELHDILDQLKPPGIGPVTLYDVATRIAAFRKLEIESLYLHAGVRNGYDRMTGKSSTGIKRLTRKELPRELLRLPTGEIEDFFCSYRDYIHVVNENKGEL